MIEFQLTKSGYWYVQARCTAMGPRWEWSNSLGRHKPSAKKQAEARKLLADAFAAEAHIRATQAAELAERLTAFALTVE